MNVKKTMFAAVAFATAAATSFAAKSNPHLQIAEESEQEETESSEGRYVAPKSYGWSALALGLATPVQLPWGIEKWDIFGLDLNLGYSDSMKMYGWEFAFGANTARKRFAGLQTCGSGQGPDDVGNGNVLAVMEFNALPKLKGVLIGAVVDGIAFRDGRHQFTVAVGLDEAFKNIEKDLAGSCRR